MPELYDYQVEAVNNILDAFKVTNKIMLQMPTGTGKTEVFCEIIRNKIYQKSGTKRVLILVHRRHLVKQINKRLLKFGLNSGIIMAGEKPTSEQIQVASIQTVVRRDVINWPHPAQVALIVIDEAHHATSSTYKKIFKHYSSNQSIKYLGVTATPCKTDKTGFKDIFDQLIVSYSIKEFIQKNYLAGFRHLATRTRSFNSVKIDPISGDYAVEALGEHMSDYTIMSELIGAYKEHANNAKCIIFAASVKHSKNIVERFLSEGITAESIDSNTPENERKNILEKFEKGKIQILSNYQIFTEGFDCPAIEVVMLARPTKSFPLYLQMIGRAIRKKENNAPALILDNACLWKTHGLITKDIQWSLSGAETSNKVVSVRNKESGEVVEIQSNKVIEDESLEMEEISRFNDDKKEIKKTSTQIDKRDLALKKWAIIQEFKSHELLLHNNQNNINSNRSAIITPVYLNNELVKLDKHTNLFGYIKEVCNLTKLQKNNSVVVKWTNQFGINYEYEFKNKNFKVEYEYMITPKSKLLFLNEIDESNCYNISHQDIQLILSNENFVTKYVVSTFYGTNWSSLRLLKTGKVFDFLKTTSNLGQVLFFFYDRSKFQKIKAKEKLGTNPINRIKKSDKVNQPSLGASFIKERLKAKKEGKPLPSLDSFIESQKRTNTNADIFNEFLE
ncbi:DEAD/DEAH box helicase [Sediminibacterium sp.]|uniref:DEAD/DEAH box helicase n=1 Tax=Sediminibacterium sp. TaxID=1917865 RepID=UPI003F710B12